MNQDNKSFFGKDTKKPEKNSTILSGRESPSVIRDDATALDVMLGNSSHRLPEDNDPVHHSLSSAALVINKTSKGSRLTRIYNRARVRRRLALVYLSFAILIICLMLLGLLELLERFFNR